ncbi:MAG TPA: MFS transporter [Acidimicrobiia bacterium]|nr:MFS transporter [Acidimicrobiia bacterium]
MKTVTQWERVEDESAWVDPDFRRLFRASALSVFGSEIGELALPLLAIITLAATPSEVGLLRAAQFLPFFLATLPLGMLIDHHAKKQLMVRADIGRFLLVAAIPISVWLGLAEIEIVYVLVFAVGCLTVLHQLCDFAYLPALVPASRIVDANSKLSAAHSGNEIAGKGVGGVIVQLLTAPFAVLFHSLTYLVSAFELSKIRALESVEPVSRSGSKFHEAITGLVAAWRHRYIRPLLLEATTFNLFNEIFILALLLHAVRGLGLDAAAIGLVFVGGGIGSFIGAWFGPKVTHRLGYGRVLLVTMAVGNAVPMAAVFTRTEPMTGLGVLVATFAVMGIGIGVANVHAVSLRQIAVRDDLRGRVNAGYRLVSWSVLPLGATIGGLLATGVGPYEAMLIGAFGLPLATVWVLFSPIPGLRDIAEAIDPMTSDPVRWLDEERGVPTMSDHSGFDPVNE